LIASASTIVIGLSGGPDSVALLYALNALKSTHNYTLVAAHLDHQWRANSAHDAVFCQELCQSLGVTLVVQTLAQVAPALKYNGSQEELGRKARRLFLQKVAAQFNAHAITLAHHANDQEETFFIRLLRGASLAGLTGMRFKNGLYIRPLLETSKKEILTFLHEQNIPYLIDPTNEQTHYLRNAIRAQVIPALRGADKRFEANFKSTLNNLQRTHDFIQQTTQAAAQKIIHDGALEIAPFLELHEVIRYQLLIDWLCTHQVPFTPSQGLLDEIIKFLKQPGSKNHMIHAQWQLIKKKEILFLEKNN
jgi:tRNA(Ile)-lysidine synthase